MSGDQPTKASNDLSCTKILAAAGASPAHLKSTCAGSMPASISRDMISVMAGGVLGQNDFLAPPVLHPEIVDRTDVAPRDHAIAAARPVDLLAPDGDGAGILDQLRGEERDHVERPPKDVRLTAGEQVARFDWIIHDGEVEVEAVLFDEQAAVVRRQAVIRRDDRRPAGQTLMGNCTTSLPSFCGAT